MGIQARNIVRLLVKAGLAALMVNEVRGFVLAGPVLYGMYEAGGTAMAMWLAFCSLAGIAMSVFVPLVLARKFKRLGAAQDIASELQRTSIRLAA